MHVREWEEEGSLKEKRWMGECVKEKELRRGERQD